MRTFAAGAIVSLLVISAAAAGVSAETPYPIAWIRQLGTSSGDGSYSVAVDGEGNAFISGYTGGDLAGPNAGGESDAFLAKYDSGGILLWARQRGTSDRDGSYSVAVDAEGNAFISGSTYGDLGGANAGESDAFLAKYDSGGNLLWTHQLGRAKWDYNWAVAVDADGNAFISGSTFGNLGGANAGWSDAFLAKYDSDGNLLWTRQLGTSTYDYSYSVAVDAEGNALVSGVTYGSLGGSSAGSNDAFLAKYDSDGNLLWTQQLGTSSGDSSTSVAVDASGNAFISGYTEGSLGGANAGRTDAFLSKFDSHGNLLWTQQLGTSRHDPSRSVAVDGSGNVFIGGQTGGTLGGSSAGYGDAFLVKFQAPDPPTVEIEIDIKPGSDTNPVNLKSKGVLAVAILGGGDFDVTQIDLGTVELAGAGPRGKGKSGDKGSFEDINGDLIVDLILHFDMQDLEIIRETSELTLVGKLEDGTNFQGTDSIRIVPSVK